jgi:hypothetical protein
MNLKTKMPSPAKDQASEVKQLRLTLANLLQEMGAADAQSGSSGAADGASSEISAALKAARLWENPVGTILMNASGVNPGTYIGGTWVAWGTGRVPVGVDVTQAEFNTVEETGGEKTHTLAVTEIPSHRHTSNQIYQNATITRYGPSRVGGTLAEAGANYTDYEGGGGAHNNLQPYITCYMWKRTA